MAKILIADDNSNIQKMVVLALKDQGIDVVAVGNGEAAVRKVSDLKPDLVLADVFMPVRNGYEVCKFVKDDPSLSHIPVILLVGAFDPLDEQEAQRVGADGVLKKPFVPPDPLISMVKSALARAGVPLEGSVAPPPMPAQAPPTAKPEIATPRKTAPIPVPELAALPEEDFAVANDTPSRPAPFSIDKGSQTLAFGSLLDSPVIDEDAVFSISPATPAVPERDWGHAEEAAEEVEEEASDSQSWRLSSALPETIDEAPAGQIDWREAAFSAVGGESSRAAGWAPSIEKNSLAITEQEAAELARKQEAIAPTATTNGKLDWAKEIAAVPVEKPRSAPAIPVPAVPVAVVNETAVAPPPPAPVFEAPDVVASVAPPVPTLAPSTAAFAPIMEEQAAIATVRLPPAPPIEAHTEIAPVEALPAPPVSSPAAPPQSSWETALNQASQLASSWDEIKKSASAVVEESAVHEAALDSAEVAADSEPEVEFAAEPALPGESAYAAESLLSPVTPEDLEEPAPSFASEAPPPELERSNSIEPTPREAPAEATATTDELVARVLAKMNPDVLQAVTREILKPLIQAMVRDELDKK